MTLFDVDEVPYRNLACEELTGEFCDAEHGVPTLTRGQPDTAAFTCPVNGRYFYEGEFGFGEWLHSRWDWTTPEWLPGPEVFTEDPGAWDYTSCCQCGDWVHYEDSRSDGWGDSYCRNCHQPHAGGESAPACHGCRTSAVTHYHVLTEEVACEEHAGPKFRPIAEAA